jgi:putative peptide zinc metalloprotease protein
VAETLLSASWYRVAALRPRVRGHAAFHRHRYRGQIWYVLHDAASGRGHRLSVAAYRLVALMDGQRTTQQVWDLSCEQLGDDAPTQDETLQLLGLLHAADVLHCDLSPDTAELLERRQQHARQAGWRRWVSPLAQKIPLLDPDRWLAHAASFVHPLFGAWGAAGWCAVVATAAILASAHSRELAAGMGRELLEPRNLLLMTLVYPLVKALHELGHALATRVWGGEVHEVGVLLLVFLPIPYVDASAASAFPDKRRRMAVGAAGIAVELFVASLALFVWLAVEPGAVRSLAGSVLWVSGLSTLLFNANPLVRFDGYFMLADAIEIPNLDSRARLYLGYLAQRHLFGIDTVRNPVTAPGEARWFVAYGLASFAYRMFVTFGIALFLAGRFFTLGVALAVFAVAMQLGVPLLRGLAFVFASPRLADRRARAVAATAGVAIGAAVVLAIVPVPSHTRAVGVVWPPAGAEVRAGADGFVVRLLAEYDATVAPGDPLVLVREPALEAEVAVLEAQYREAEARHDAERTAGAARANDAREDLATAEVALAHARERLGDAIVRSSTHGRFVLPAATHLVGRYVRRGELLGWVVGPTASTVRVALRNADLAQVREHTPSIEVRMSRNLGRAIPATLASMTPAATDRLPSAALGRDGGGPFAVDPDDTKGLRTLEPIFVLDLALPAEDAVPEIGGRAYVRFEHSAEPVIVQGWRALRQLFLRRLGV